MMKRNKNLLISMFIVGLLLIKSAELFAVDKYRVVDGDSLEKGNVRIRLIDIDAPEFYQKCYDENNNSYECGKMALRALEKLIDNKVVCKAKAIDKYKRKLMECFDENNNSINQQMVLSGWAVSYGNKFKEEEMKAKKQKSGIWKGRFMRPELYRALHKN